MRKIIILPGNGNTNINQDHWYAWVRDQLRHKGYQVIAENMPDPDLAHKNIWLPHIKNHFAANEQTVIIGHSSGGVATLRYLEENKLLGAIVAGVNHTDLGFPEEKESGYYNTPWNWAAIKKNAHWLVQFASQDDPYIPIREPRLIHEKLDTEYHEYTDQGHFGSEYKEHKTFPEIIEVITRKVTP